MDERVSFLLCQFNCRRSDLVLHKNEFQVSKTCETSTAFLDDYFHLS